MMNLETLMERPPIQARGVMDSHRTPSTAMESLMDNLRESLSTNNHLSEMSRTLREQIAERQIA